MRLGPLGYDAMSLIMDPYTALAPTLREDLLGAFCHAVAGEYSPQEVRAMGVAAGLQRLMQALGAYGFLGHVKGKSAFLQHIPVALRHLRELLAALPSSALSEARFWLPENGLPALTALADQLDSHHNQ
jgi:aminoglycoside/choline kinase family phosphotransferase